MPERIWNEFMAVGFIIGRSGTGKSRFCIDSVVKVLAEKDTQKNLILLVPEQATYQAEQAVLSKSRIAGYSENLNILSFDRLRFLLLGKNSAKVSVSQLGRQMIIQRLLGQLKGRLKVYAGCADRAGLGPALARTVSEIHSQARTPQDIEALVGRLAKTDAGGLAARKFADIALLLRGYADFIEGKFIDPDMQLNLLRKAIANAGWLKNALLWVDGFAGFTNAELAILAELIKRAQDTTIALCMDPEGLDLTESSLKMPDRISLFYPTQKTYAQLLEIIGELKIPLAETVILNQPHRYKGCAALKHLEKNIFRQKQKKAAAENCIRIVRARDLRSEVTFVARCIAELVRTGNFRYRDIAVVAPELDSYEHYIEACFNDYSIPYFIDKRRLLYRHQLIEMICSVLEAVTGGLASSNIFSFLKSGLGPLSDEDIFELENYCLAFGVTAGDFESAEDWDFAGSDSDKFDQRRINNLRTKAVGALLEMKRRFYRSDGTAEVITVEQFTQIVFEFIEAIGVRQRLTGQIERALETGSRARALEHRQVFEGLVGVFDELTEIFKGCQAKVEEFFAVLKSAFFQMTGAFIPPGLDEVLVGSIERSRHPELKVVFLIGATERQFPVPLPAQGILTDSDIKAAGEQGLSLGLTNAARLIDRQYLAYIAFTRPGRLLYITWPAKDSSGSETARSQFVAELQSLFDGLVEESAGSEPAGIGRIYNKNELGRLLCERLSPYRTDAAEGDAEIPAEIYDDIRTNEDFADLAELLDYAFGYNNDAALDKKTAAEVFKEGLRTSATKLAAFAACPYRYFARYILELEKRREFKLEPLDVGRFYHCALDGFIKKINVDKKDITTMEAPQLLGILHQQVSQLIEVDSFISRFRAHSSHNAFIINSAVETLEEFVLAIKEISSAGAFRPYLCESGFGDVKNCAENIGRLRFNMPDGRELFIDGKIDRLDAAEIDGRKLSVVFDYKKAGGQSFSWPRFFHGLDVQLPIYILAAGRCDKSDFTDCVGAFFLPVEPRLKNTRLEKASGEGVGFYYKAKGIFNGDFAGLIDGKTKIKDSSFYSFYVTKDGAPYGYYGSRDILRPDDFEKVLNFTEEKIISLAGQMAEGKIRITPYRLGGASPCSFCEYHSLCRFDWQINDYNFLESIGKEDVLKKIGGRYGQKTD